MALLVFDAGDMNSQGICRGWAADWIKRCKSGQVITRRADLSSEAEVKQKFDAGNAVAINDGVDAQFGLAALSTLRNSSPPIPASWVATELTKGTAYYLFAVRGKTLNLKKGTFDNSGHAMATRKGYGALQFFDPNGGLVEFTNSLEFFDWLPNYISSTYADLLSRQAEVRKF